MYGHSVTKLLHVFFNSLTLKGLLNKRALLLKLFVNSHMPQHHKSLSVNLLLMNTWRVHLQNAERVRKRNHVNDLLHPIIGLILRVRTITLSKCWIYLWSSFDSAWFRNFDFTRMRIEFQWLSLNDFLTSDL